jgi:hypothetical protein
MLSRPRKSSGIRAPAVIVVNRHEQPLFRAKHIFAAHASFINSEGKWRCRHKPIISLLAK